MSMKVFIRTLWFIVKSTTTFRNVIISLRILVNISLLALSSTAGLLFFREKRINRQVAQKYNNNNSSCNSSSSSSSGNSSNISFVDSEASPKLSKLRKVFLLANLLALLGIIYFNYTLNDNISDGTSNFGFIFALTVCFHVAIGSISKNHKFFLVFCWLLYLHIYVFYCMYCKFTV